MLTITYSFTSHSQSIYVLEFSHRAFI